MPWSNNSGGPWGDRGGDGGGSGGGRGPWGGGGGGGGGQRPPDIDELLRQGRERLKVIVGGGGGRGSGGIPPLGKKGFAAIGVAIAALWVAGSVYTVKPEERAVELFFGEYLATTEPGLNFAPWPFVTYEKRPVTRENIVDIGYDSAAARARGRDADAGLMLTGDENIVDIDFQVVWNISDLRNHLFNIVSPEETIRAVSESAMREVIGQSELGPILNRDRALVAQQVRDRIQETMDGYEAGVRILRVNFDRADPPPEVIDAFRDVQAAAQDRDTSEKQAEAYANRALAEARGEAAEILQSAEAYAAQTVNEAEGEAARFISIADEYANAPDVTRKRLYLETMERIFGDVEKVIIDEGANQAGGGGVVPYLPLDRLRRSASNE